jgi:hypothetical protein
MAATKKSRGRYGGYGGDAQDLDARADAVMAATKKSSGDSTRASNPGSAERDMLSDHVFFGHRAARSSGAANHNDKNVRLEDLSFDDLASYGV